MVSEVCNLLLRCLTFKEEEICEQISPYQAVIGGIIYLLNGDLYQNYDEVVLREITGNIMQLLNAMVAHKVGIQLITGVLSELKLEPLLRLIVLGVSNHKQKGKFIPIFILSTNHMIYLCRIPNCMPSVSHFANAVVRIEFQLCL